MAHKVSIGATKNNPNTQPMNQLAIQANTNINLASKNNLLPNKEVSITEPQKLPFGQSKILNNFPNIQKSKKGKKVVNHIPKTLPAE